MAALDPNMIRSLVSTLQASAGSAASHVNVQNAIAALRGMGGAARSAFGDGIAAFSRKYDYRPFGLGAYVGPTAAGQTSTTVTLLDSLKTDCRLYIVSANLASIDDIQFDTGSVPLGFMGSAPSGAGAVAGNGPLPAASVDQLRVMLASGFHVPAGTKSIKVTVTTASGAAPWGMYLLGCEPGLLKLPGCRDDG